MASLKKRPRSPFWWISWRDPQNGLTQRSTGLRWSDPLQTRRARELCAEKSLLEVRTLRLDSEALWDAWVPDFIKVRHAESPNTLRRTLTTWRTLRSFLTAHKVHSPQQLAREIVLRYLDWRKPQGRLNARSGAARGVAHNTALLELRVLSGICQEAVRRRWCQSNPCARLEIKRVPPKVKDELSDEQVAVIRAEIQRRLRQKRQHADFLHVSFEIALAQGCRLAETHLALADVDEARGLIRFLAKGRRAYEAPLNPSLLPLFKRLRKERRTLTYQRPPMPSLVWFKFFHRLRQRHHDLARVSFHSTRVSLTSRMERAGIAEAVVMKIVNHASTTVHRVYRRVKASEAAPAWQALSYHQP